MYIDGWAHYTAYFTRLYIGLKYLCDFMQDNYFIVNMHDMFWFVWHFFLGMQKFIQTNVL